MGPGFRKDLDLGSNGGGKKIKMLFSTLIAVVLLPFFVQGSSDQGYIKRPGYAPSIERCGDTLKMIRTSDGISTGETKFLYLRLPHASSSLHSFMSYACGDFSADKNWVDKVMKNYGPRVGIAVSGGGYRAVLGGAGMLAALDNRTDGAYEHGLGGVLQGATYIAGISGGSWLVGSLVANNWTSVQTIVDTMGTEKALWNLTYSFTETNATGSASKALMKKINSDVSAKQAAGFDVSLSDYVGRAVSYSMMGNVTNESSFVMSGITDVDAYKKGLMPMPMIVADFKSGPNEVITSLNSTVMEVNPFEFGSWGKPLAGFALTEDIGTSVKNGEPTRRSHCTRKFDQLGFMLGASSSYFNPLMNETLYEMFSASELKTVLNQTSSSEETALFSPNPFKNVHSARNTAFYNNDILNLVDGGEDSQNIPLVPLLQKGRDVSVVFALDFSAETSDNWPNGTSLVATYQRQFSDVGKDISFPPVPSVEEYVASGLHKKVTFFGCDSSTLKGLRHTPPLVVYMPNSEYSYASNTSTDKTSYTLEEQAAMIKNGFEAATMGNYTKDADFRSCIACAISRRKQQSKGLDLPGQCEECFSNYCWNGTLVDITN